MTLVCNNDLFIKWRGNIG